MVAIWNRADHYIFALWFLLSFFFFPRLISAVGDWMTAILPHMVWHCGLSANLGCRSETCCTRLAENAGRKKSPSAHHHTNLSGYIFATACIDNRKKNMLSSNVSSRRPHNMVNVGLLAAEIGLGSLPARQSGSGRQPNFAALNRGRHLCSAGRPSRWALSHILVLSFFLA